MSKRSKKGSSFEREFAHQLSLWWTNKLPEPADDIFWRTSGSGARATTRGKKNKRTSGQYGDICCIDIIGKPLLDLVTIEVKRGYSHVSVADVLDRTYHSAQQEWEQWIQQAEESHTQAGSKSWLLVQRRDKRLPVVFFPRKLYQMLLDVDCFSDNGTPMFHLEVFLRSVRKSEGTLVTSHNPKRIVGTTLANWFLNVDPDRVKEIVQCTID